MAKSLPDLPSRARLTCRHLPHLDVPGVPTFVTFRLSDSLPESVRRSLFEQARQWQKEHRTSDVVAHKHLIALTDRYLDESAAQLSGPCYLKHPEACERLKTHLSWGVSNYRYLLHAYCIMSNHVHILLETLPKTGIRNFEVSWHGSRARRMHVDRIVDQDPLHIPVEYWALSEVMQGLKSCSSKDINQFLNRSGKLWQVESFDHVIRDEAEYHRVSAYIENNPVKAGLCRDAADWHFSSAGEKMK